MKLTDVVIDEIIGLNKKNMDILKMKLNVNEKNALWAFCLGAGTSISCGLPDWSKLLAMISGKILKSYSKSYEIDNQWMKIMAEEIEKTLKNNEFVEKIEKASNGKTANIYGGVDLLELAEYLRAMIKEQLRVSDETLIDEILCDYIRECYNIHYDLDGKISNYDTSTLRAVVETMEKRKIRRAITYNYDDLLEIALQRDGNKVESIVPDEQKEFTEDDEIYKIYHCHGLVPVKYMGDEKPSKIILTETSYYNEESSSYSLANVLQAYSMNYCNLLYVGFSGADYTFRRIIRGMNRNGDKINHYIFFCVDDIVNMVYEGTDKKIEKEDFIRQLKKKNEEYDYERLMVNQMVVSKTLYWEDKGMKVIWSTQSELPEMLMNL